MTKMINPGIHADMSNAEYHGGMGYSKSSLDIINKTPAHFLAAKEAGPRESTPDQRFGTIIHDAILEPATFWDRYAKPFKAPEGVLVTMDDIKSRLKDLDQKVTGKKDELIDRLKSVHPEAVFLDDLKAAHADENEGKEIVTDEEMEKVEAIRASVMSHPTAGKLLNPNDGDAELSCYWKDPVTGLNLRCRPDFWNRKLNVIVDLKTSRDASPEGFPKSVQDWRYNVQQAFYQDGIEQAIKQGSVAREVPKRFVFVVVEKTAPYAVAVYNLDPMSVDIGRRDYRRNLDTLAACVAKNEWPAYSTKTETSGLPEWRLRQEEFEQGEAA